MNNLATLGLLSMLTPNSKNGVGMRAFKFAQEYIFLIELPGFTADVISVTKNSITRKVDVKGEWNESLRGLVPEKQKKELKEKFESKLAEYSMMYDTAVADDDDDVKSKYLAKLEKLKSNIELLEKGEMITPVKRRVNASFKIPKNADIVGKNMPFTYQNGILKIVVKRKEPTN
jgi:HSP20 family molecular chaperone IbpA